jgi:hypothetical protein
MDDRDIYSLVDGIKARYQDIKDLNYVLMWRYNIKPDKDGCYILLADISKSSDKVRELRPHDVIIGINKTAWQLLDDMQKKLVISSQLLRVAPCKDKEGIHKEDDRSRAMYRLKRIEVIDEEMMSIYGTTMRQVQERVISMLSGKFDKNSYVGRVLDNDTNSGI